MSKQCGFVGLFIGKKKTEETAHKYTKCCHDGKVRLPAFAVALELLKALLTENSPSLRWERKLYHYMKLDHTVTVYMVKCTTEFPSCMQVTNIKKVTDSFIYLTPVRQQINA
ncbi:hypothetical protein AVEN_237128-1 [Araneus ventricosus]|uniref:Uncharacterized protein n=1 Tax=Araneus ventricosus TaxID=182803 RepID=A0A4Y2CGT7_ARAVE|nr:hypothetical protein AVEN_237128-1 [Araneus ventricosus]